jgi:hypothetical protein
VLAILSRQFPAQLSGRVSTANNVIMFLIAFAFQWGIGAILDQWPVIDGHYAQSGYQTAFGVLFAMQVATYALLVIAENPAIGAAARPSRPKVSQ